MREVRPDRFRAGFVVEIICCDFDCTTIRGHTEMVGGRVVGKAHGLVTMFLYGGMVRIFSGVPLMHRTTLHGVVFLCVLRVA
jgi:hypothetical protein